MEINKGQKEAIKHFNGPMIVLAGPGSGKTFVITQRTKNLIEEYKVPEDKILVITFTKAAANEMKERFISLQGSNKTKVSFGTFHSIFFLILRREYGFKISNIIKENEKNLLVKELIQKYRIEYEDENEIISTIISEISLVKVEKINIDNYYSANCADDVFRSIYKDYQSNLKKYRRIDFDDMLVMTYDLFTKNKRTLKLWQEKFEYILIDEFQDINLIQYKIIQMLAQEKNNLFIVGDDDQSIYQFRGAKPEIMHQFTKDYPLAKTTLLNKNYRSSENIVKAALNLVKRNNIRFEKDISPSKSIGSDIEVLQLDNVNLQSSKIVREIKKYMQKGLKLENIAILVRTNIGHHNLLYKLLEHNIPFIIKDNLPNIYEHWIARDIFAYINIAQGENTRSNYLRIMNKPKRYISRDCLDSPSIDIEDIIKYYDDKYWMIERLDNFDRDLRQLKKMSPYAAITYIRRGIDYESYLKEHSDTRKISYEELIDILDELQENAKNFNTVKEWYKSISDYKKELETQSTKNKELDAVNILTIHSSKGLEYEVVFIIDVNEDIIPHKKAIHLTNIEEERRLFYVAMTRAKEHLHIYSTRERYNKELSPSRFLKEILE